MHSTQVGGLAEAIVAEFLKARGYSVIAKNWRTKTCEIDLIAFKNMTIFFIEVKYRSTSFQGSGFDYITPAKLRRMRYAANLWVAKNRWRGRYCLSVASVGGQSNKISFIEQINDVW